jgi:prepilin-type N-terminal cleavage/methylation domain-containing protein
MKYFIQNKKLGFSLIELSIVILVIGILVIGISKGSRVISEAKLKSAQSLTNSSPINTMDDLVFWLETTNPENIASGDFDASPQDFESSLSEGSLISSWRYLIPSKADTLNVVAESDAARPTYTESGINGLPAIHFEGTGGTSHFLSNPQNIFPAGQQKYAMIAVFSGDTISAETSYVFHQVGGCGGAAAGIIMQGGQIGSFGCGSGDFRGPATAVSNNANYIITISVDRTTSPTTSIYLNSKTITLSGDPATAALGTSKLSIGDVGNSSSISLSELILLDDALKPSEIAEAQNYLSKKYGIKLN